MKYIDKRTFAKYIFIAVAIGIAVSFLLISNQMTDDLAKEERQKVELWAEALQTVANKNDSEELNLTLKILSGNKSIPVILCDDDDTVLLTSNLDIPEEDSTRYLNKKIAEFKKRNERIVVENENFQQYIYYGDSYTLKRLQYYPFIQLGILTVFICVSFLALLSTKNAEQNKVWVGLSKETAHQLGTPISSIIAWVDYLKSKMSDAKVLDEMEKDVMRLQMVADRFSKIGSRPAPESVEIREQIELAMSYLEKRISKKVVFTLDMPTSPVYANISVSLFGWVIENLTKNAVDAMEGKGSITLSLYQKGGLIYIDISDSGKGLPKSMYKKIFSPGFTTKERGWGLGLSLAKRIIEDYHKGRIYVASSEVGVGTTFRIELKNI